MYWRIVRINGDGTLRLMYIGTSPDATGINSYAGESRFNANSNEPKYTGYTYDNSSPNVQDGTPSDMKNYLDTWFERSLSDESSAVATSQFYADSNYVEANDVMNYNSLVRLQGVVSPTLKTSETTETYGGEYYLKVGLLNADELVLSGYDGVWGSSGYSEAGTLYPYTTNTSKWLWSLSPCYFNGNTGFVFYVSSFGILSHEDVHGTNGVAPVISLTTEYSKQLRGLGTQDVPLTAD